MELVIVRHGRTPGNELHRYVGILDQPLSDAGREQARTTGAWPDIDHVYVSRLRRTHETAAILFPNARQTVVDDIHEMNFGVFAGRSADDMADDPEYRTWVDSFCTSPCPGGEKRSDFENRVCAALERTLREAEARGEERVIMVAHGGTMMAALDRFADDPREYYEWLVGNCEGYRIDVDLAGSMPRFLVLSRTIGLDDVAAAS